MQSNSSSQILRRAVSSQIWCNSKEIYWDQGCYIRTADAVWKWDSLTTAQPAYHQGLVRKYNSYKPFTSVANSFWYCLDKIIVKMLWLLYLTKTTLFIINSLIIMIQLKCKSWACLPHLYASWQIRKIILKVLYTEAVNKCNSGITININIERIMFHKIVDSD